MRKIVFILVLLVAASAGFGQQTKSCKPCEALMQLQYPEVTILSAVHKSSDTIKSPFETWMPTVIINRPFCRVLGRISAEINFELLLPDEGNGRFLMSGGGGFVGSIQNAFRQTVNEGYATAGTDAGHQGGDNAKWAYNHVERQLNFGRLAVHRTAVVSKLIMQQYYCSPPFKSYFVGCSRGGGQAMMEAQYYPEDFDGIVAGAPAYSWPGIGAKGIVHSQNIYPDPNGRKGVITAANLKLLQAEVLKQCDQLDGSLDGILEDPRKCKFDFSKLPVCPDSQPGGACFTKEQIAAIKAVYAPVKVEGKEVYPGYPYGGEAENGSWDIWIVGTSPFSPNGRSLHDMFATNIFKYFIFNDSTWDYTKYDFRDFFKQTAYAASYLDATLTDYSHFRQRNGKIIFFHGWNDPALSAFSTIEHFEGILQQDRNAMDYARLFLLPGVLHCSGGPGCDDVNWISLIVDWVEKGKAPDEVVATKNVQGKLVSKRILPYTR